MSKTPPTNQEMTDVFSRFPDSIPPLKQPADAKISARQKALLSTAAVLLGGGAAFAAVNYDQIRDYFDSNEGEPTTPAPVRNNEESLVQNGTITPGENIDIASQVDEAMSFGAAYAAAREEVGPGGIFSWHGEVFNTYTVEEWQGLSLGQRQEFLSDVGYRPTESTPELGEPAGTEATVEELATVDSDVPVTEPEAVEDEVPAAVAADDFVTEDVSDEPELEPEYFDLVINGRPALGIDDDHDGIADAIVFIDEATSDIIAFVDAESDERIDTIIQFNTSTQQIVGQQAIEEPFTAEISRLEALSYVAAESDDPDFAYVDSAESTFGEDDNDYTADSGYVNDAEIPEMD